MKKSIAFSFATLIFSSFFAFAESGATLKITGDYTSKDAEIFINEDSVGYVPKTFTKMIPGIYKIRLEKFGYDEKSELIELIDDEEREIYFALEKATEKKEEILEGNSEEEISEKLEQIEQKTERKTRKKEKRK